MALDRLCVADLQTALKEQIHLSPRNKQRFTTHQWHVHRLDEPRKIARSASLPLCQPGQPLPLYPSEVVRWRV